MAQRKPEEPLAFDQVLKLVDALAPEERRRLYRHLQFRPWDEGWNRVKHILINNELPKDNHQQPMKTFMMSWIPCARQKMERQRREIQKAIDELDRGEGLPVEQVIAELRERNKAIKRISIEAAYYRPTSMPRTAGNSRLYS